MKKIGILTFHKYYNYGTVLQAYALENYINRNYSCKAEIIDYVVENEYIGKKLVLTRLKRMGTYIKNFPMYYTLFKNQHFQSLKNKEFDLFIEKNMRLSEGEISSIEELCDTCKAYDAIMVGSDQTWNPYVSTKGVFLLDYLDGNQVTKLAYAPSIGISKIPDELQERYENSLSSFRALSCRERSGAIFLSHLLGREVPFVLDPTLMLNASEWEEVATPMSDIDKPYLLTYFLGDNKEHRKMAAQIALDRGLKIISLPVSYLEMKNKLIENRYVGPSGFISLIKNATFVCTDSFHGTMFSINFEREFLSFPKRNDSEINSDNNRLYDVLNVLGLEKRLITDGISKIDFIDYVQVNNRIRDLRVSSKKFLSEALELI